MLFIRYAYLARARTSGEVEILMVNVKMNENKCRVCLQEDKTGKSLNIFTTTRFTEDGAVPLRFLIEEIASIEIDRIDGYPESICAVCFVKLETAYNFRILCVSTHCQLKKQNKTGTSLDDGAFDVIEDEIEPLKPKTNETVPTIITDPVSLEKELDNPKIDVSTHVNLLKTAVNGEKWLDVLKKEKKLPRLEYKLVPYHEYVKNPSLKKKFSYATSNVQYTQLPSSHRTIKQEKCGICEYCGLMLQTRNLEPHVMRHTGVRPFKCHTCGALKCSISDLKVHMVNHTSKKIKCKLCGKTLKTRKSYMSHINHHYSTKRHKCELCLKTFTRIQSYRRHKLTHNYDSHKCEICDCGFKRYYELAKHLDAIHGIKVEFKAKAKS